MKTIIVLTIAIITAFGLQSFTQQNLTGRQIVEKAETVNKLKGSEMIGVLRIIDQKGRERVRKISIASKKNNNGVEKRIMKFLSPADVKGTGILIFDYESKDDDMWIYLPALRKTRRIVSSEKNKSFMGSEFTNADMSSPNLDEFNYKLSGSETVDGVDCWKVEVTPKDENIADENGYSKRILFIGKKDYVGRKTIYYDLDGELHKVLIAKNIKLIDVNNKKYMAIEMLMTNEQNNRKSIWIVEKIEVNPDVKDEYFTTSYLEKI